MALPSDLQAILLAHLPLAQFEKLPFLKTYWALRFRYRYQRDPAELEFLRTTELTELEFHLKCATLLGEANSFSSAVLPQIAQTVAAHSANLSLFSKILTDTAALHIDWDLNVAYFLLRPGVENAKKLDARLTKSAGLSLAAYVNIAALAPETLLMLLKNLYMLNPADQSFLYGYLQALYEQKLGPQPELKLLNFEYHYLVNGYAATGYLAAGGLDLKNFAATLRSTALVRENMEWAVRPGIIRAALQFNSYPPFADQNTHREALGALCVGYFATLPSLGKPPFKFPDSRIVFYQYWPQPIMTAKATALRPQLLRNYEASTARDVFLALCELISDPSLPIPPLYEELLVRNYSIMLLFLGKDLSRYSLEPNEDRDGELFLAVHQQYFLQLMINPLLLLGKIDYFMLLSVMAARQQGDLLLKTDSLLPNNILLLRNQVFTPGKIENYETFKYYLVHEVQGIHHVSYFGILGWALAKQEIGFRSEDNNGDSYFVPTVAGVTPPAASQIFSYKLAI